jgi:hypothetical protein
VNDRLRTTQGTGAKERAGIEKPRPWARARRPLRERVAWTACSIVVLCYSIWVLIHVARMGTIGVRCMFDTKVEEEIPDDYAWDGERPQKGERLVSIGDQAMSASPYVGYAGYIRAMRGLRGQVGGTI